MGERLMSSFTLEILRLKKEEIAEQLKRLGSDRSGDQRAGMHDEPAIENTKNLLRSALVRIGDLSRVKIIQPRRDVDIVDIGNRVRVGFQDGDEELMFLLGPDDAVHRNELGPIISYESPLGKAIRGRKKNEEVRFNLSKSASQRVKILDILAGGF